MDVFTNLEALWMPCFRDFYGGFNMLLSFKESACKVRDPGLIPGLRRSIGEGIGHLLQYSWASLVAQLVKNLLAMWETPVWSLCPKKIKSGTVSIVSHLFAMKWWDWTPWSLCFECWILSQLFHSPLSLSSRGSLFLLCFLHPPWHFTWCILHRS